MLQVKPQKGRPINITGFKAIKPRLASPTCGSDSPDQLAKPPC